MGKNLIQQARGKGGPRYRCPSFRFHGKVKHFIGDGIVEDIIKDPGHSAPLLKIASGGKQHLIIAPEGIRVGQSVQSGPDAELKTGNTLPMKNIPEGTNIFNIESSPGDGGRFVRSSGGTAKVLSHHKDKVTVMLPSKKPRVFQAECKATVGLIAGSGRKEKPFLKAGKRHHYMKARNKLYPKVCGTSMNAIDHPFGGASSHSKGHPMTVSRNAPPGRKVGRIAARRTGKKR
ncbi:MAG: 50S ribosomal protein L2 [Nanoarchaeota archaeon]|nr:50S ribosomal protein L2 [Nanoarchaeota archaeon]